MATLTFAAVEDLGHSDNDIPNPDLSEMDSNTVRGQVMLGLRPACPTLMNLVKRTILTLLSY